MGKENFFNHRLEKNIGSFKLISREGIFEIETVVENLGQSTIAATMPGVSAGYSLCLQSWELRPRTRCAITMKFLMDIDEISLKTVNPR